MLPPEHISEEQITQLKQVFDEADEEFQKNVFDYLERNGISKDFSNFPLKLYERIYNTAKQKRKAIEVKDV